MVCSVYPTAESDSLGVQPQSMTPWCASYRGVRLPSVHLKAKLLQYSKNLAEIEKECEKCKYFRLFITAKIGSNHEKIKVQNLVTHSLSRQYYLLCHLIDNKKEIYHQEKKWDRGRN